MNIVISGPPSVKLKIRKLPKKFIAPNDAPLNFRGSRCGGQFGTVFRPYDHDHESRYIIWTKLTSLVKNYQKNYQTVNILFSKFICAEVSKMTGASKQVFHQTVNAQNSMLTREIHDQGKNYFDSLNIFYYLLT